MGRKLSFFDPEWFQRNADKEYHEMSLRDHAVRDVLESLDPDDFDLLLMRYYERLSFREMAIRLELTSKEGARQRLLRCLARVEERLETVL